MSGLNKYSFVLSANILRNTSHTTAFGDYKRFKTKVLDYHVNVPFYKINLDAAYKRTPVF